MKVLVVDDVKENRHVLKALLKNYGHEVDTANNGEQALEKLHAGDFGMVISDIAMPVMDGYQLCNRVRADEKLKDILFLIYTAAYFEESDEEFAMSLGADGFIRKPLDPETFIDIINDLLCDMDKCLVDPSSKE